MRIVKPTVVPIVIAVMAIAIGADTAFAQRATSRPSSGGLFGATRSDVGARNKLNFTFEVAQGYDSELPIELAPQVQLGQELQSGGASTILAAASDYRYGHRRFSLSGNATTSFRYFQDADRFDPMGHSAGVTASVKLPNGSLVLDQGFAYSPSYLYQLFPVDQALESSIPVNPDYRITQTDSLTYRTNAALSFGSDNGTQFRASGGLNRTDFDQQDLGRLNLDLYEAGAEVSRYVKRNLRLRGGYTFRTGEYGVDEPTKEHAATIGVEYSVPLSRTRRLGFRMDVTPTRLELPGSIVSAPIESTLPDVSADAGADAASVATDDAHAFRLSTEASVTYPFRLNWSVAARYRRSVEYLPVLGQPVLPDGGWVDVTGLISRRIDITASAGYFAATSAVGAGQALDSGTGQVTVRYAMKRWIALSSQYLYYRYDMREPVTAVIGPPLPARFDQHGVRVGAVLFLEALGR